MGVLSQDMMLQAMEHPGRGGVPLCISSSSSASSVLSWGVQQGKLAEAVTLCLQRGAWEQAGRWAGANKALQQHVESARTKLTQECQQINEAARA